MLSGALQESQMLNIFNEGEKIARLGETVTKNGTGDIVWWLSRVFDEGVNGMKTVASIKANTKTILNCTWRANETTAIL